MIQKNRFFGLRLLILLDVTMLLSSCIITRTPGFYSGYRRMPAVDKASVVIVANKDTLPTVAQGNTLAITAAHLANVIRDSVPCIVYLWTPFCSGNVCISIPAFRQFCAANGYKPIVLAEYFDYEQLRIQNVTFNEVYAINHWHYKTDYCNAYVRRFQQDLFDQFGVRYDPKAFNQYLYFDGKQLSNKLPSTLSSYPWR
jgi:hypothetical protein